MKANVAAILGDWGESVSVYQRRQSYDASGMRSGDFQEISDSAFTGRLRPVSGLTQEAEQGMDVKSVAELSCVGCMASAGDKVKVGSDYYYVNYIKKRPTHWTLFLTRTEPA